RHASWSARLLDFMGGLAGKLRNGWSGCNVQRVEASNGLIARAFRLQGSAAGRAEWLGHGHFALPCSGIESRTDETNECIPGVRPAGLDGQRPGGGASPGIRPRVAG